MPPPEVLERALGWLRVLDVAIEAAGALGDSRRGDLLQRRAVLVAALPGGAVEAVATRHAVASELERAGRATAAAALWMQLADDPASHGAGRRVALPRRVGAGGSAAISSCARSRWRRTASSRTASAAR